jgi:hypothetical protein
MIPKASTGAVWREAAASASRPVGLPFPRMWRRLRRRTFAPSRPAVFPDQIGLLVITLVAMAVGIYVVARFLL